MEEQKQKVRGCMLNVSPNDWALGIRRVDNGFIIERPSDSEHAINRESVLEFRDGLDYSGPEYSVAKDLLYEVAEYFGLIPGKHSGYLLKIEILKRDSD